MARRRPPTAAPARLKVRAADVAGELLPGASIPLLQELHLLTRDGDLNADARRKLKQVNHLIGLLRPALDDLLTRFADPLIVDCGAGKSYLGFLLYQLLLAPAGRGQLHLLESRAELCAAATERAARLQMTRLHIQARAIADAELPARVHAVVALHACDTATDEALLLALRHHADYVALVPCCQAEVARQLAAKGPADPVLAALCAHPWHRRELGSHLTNVLRVLALEAHGYKVTVTELVGWEHSLKNELLLGKRVQREDAGKRAQLAQVAAAFAVQPTLLRALDAAPENPPPG